MECGAATVPSPKMIDQYDAGNGVVEPFRSMPGKNIVEDKDLPSVDQPRPGINDIAALRRLVAAPRCDNLDKRGVWRYT